MMSYPQTEFPDYIKPDVAESLRRASLTRKWGFINIYICNRCQYAMTTVDIDEGVTPFYTRCRSCGKPEARSSMYRVGYDHVKPTHAWYRPDTLDGIMDWGTQKHLMDGGLILRELTEEELSWLTI